MRVLQVYSRLWCCYEVGKAAKVRETDNILINDEAKAAWDAKKKAATSKGGPVSNEVYVRPPPKFLQGAFSKKYVEADDKRSFLQQMIMFPRSSDGECSRADDENMIRTGVMEDIGSFDKLDLLIQDFRMGHTFNWNEGGMAARGGSPMPDMDARGGSPMPDMEARGGSPMPDMDARGGSPMPDMEGRGGSPMPDMEARGGSPMPDMEGRGGSPMPDTGGGGDDSKKMTKIEKRQAYQKALEEVEKDPEFAGALKAVKEDEAYERSLKLTGGSSKNEYRDERPNRSLDDDYHVYLAGNEGYQRQLEEMKAKASTGNFVPISS